MRAADARVRVRLVENDVSERSPKVFSPRLVRGKHGVMQRIRICQKNLRSLFLYFRLDLGVGIAVAHRHLCIRQTL